MKAKAEAFSHRFGESESDQIVNAFQGMRLQVFG